MVTSLRTTTTTKKLNRLVPVVPKNTNTGFFLLVRRRPPVVASSIVSIIIGLCFVVTNLKQNNLNIIKLSESTTTTTTATQEAAAAAATTTTTINNGLLKQKVSSYFSYYGRVLFDEEKQNQSTTTSSPAESLPPPPSGSNSTAPTATLSFCEDCLLDGSSSSGKKKQKQSWGGITCQLRAQYFQKRYGHSLELSRQAVLQNHPNNCVSAPRTPNIESTTTNPPTKLPSSSSSTTMTSPNNSSADYDDIQRLLQPQLNLTHPYSWEKNTATKTDPNSSIKLRRTLNFLHIPKTGGSSVVQAGIEAGLNWGICLFEQGWDNPPCPNPPTIPWQPDSTGLGRFWHHTPIQYLPMNRTNPYDTMDLFAVVRNPYERALSEIFYRCNVRGFNNNLLCNDILQKTDDTKAVKLLNYKMSNYVDRVKKAKPGSKEYFTDWGHWIPQHDFIFDTTTTTTTNNNGKEQQQQQQQQRRRMVKHMIHFEHLSEQFNSLMKAYGLQAALPKQKLRPRREAKAKSGNFLGIHNLTYTTLQNLERTYAADFELGGYPKITSYFKREDWDNKVWWNAYN